MTAIAMSPQYSNYPYLISVVQGTVLLWLYCWRKASLLISGPGYSFIQCGECAKVIRQAAAGNPAD